MDLRKTEKTMNKMLLEREEMLEKMAQEPEKMTQESEKIPESRKRTHQSLHRAKRNMKPITISQKNPEKKIWDTQRNQREKKTAKKK